MALYFDQSGGTERISLQDFEPSFGEKFGAAVGGQKLEEYTSSLSGLAELATLRNEPKLSAADAKSYLDTFDFKMNLVPKDNEYSKGQLDLIAARQRELAIINDVRDRTPWDLGSVPRGLAMFGVSMADPVNLAGAFVPWTRAIPLASRLQAMRVSTSALTRAGGRAGLGAIDAAISTAVLEPIYAYARRELGDDYDGYDSMQNIAFGALVGGGIVGIGGAAADVFRKQLGRVAPSERFKGLSTDEIMLVQSLDAEIKKGAFTPTALNAILDSYTPEMRRAAGFPEGRVDGDIIDQQGFVRAKSTRVNITEMDGVITASNAAGFVRAVSDNGVIRITDANVPQVFRNQGNASAITEALVNRAVDNGLTVETGATVSKDFVNVMDALERNGFTITRNQNIAEGAPTDEFPSGTVTSTDGQPVFKIDRGPEYTKPEDLAVDQVSRADPETREAVMRAGVAQMAEGKIFNIDPIMRTDPNVDGTVTAADLVQAARNSDAPENVGAADFQASEKIADENATSQKWDSVADAQQALDEADNILNTAIKNGDDAFKYSRGADAPLPANISPLGFYSALQQNVAASVTKSSTPEGWKQAIKGMVNKGLVKQDEVDWTGINDWLDLQPAKVSKEDVAAFIENNGVRIEEVKLGDLNAVEFETFLTINDLRVEPEGDARWFIEGPTGSVTVAKSAAETEANAKAFGVRYFNSQINERNRELKAKADTTKYGKYTLPGGENYRELLLTLPFKESGLPTGYGITKLDYDDGTSRYFVETPTTRSQGYTNEADAQLELERTTKDLRGFRENLTAYRSSHWDQPNIISHIRINDRVDANGAKVLFVEELQSDWAQEGRKKGFRTDEANKAEVEFKEYSIQLAEKYDLNPSQNLSMYASLKKITPEEIAKYTELQKAWTQTKEGITPAPFIQDTKSWLSLSLKRIINYASENGYDKVAFINGRQSADRYNLSKQISSLRAPYDNGEYVVSVIRQGEDEYRDVGRFREENLENAVGKEMATKIIADKGKMGIVYSEPDFRMGGEGMISFYDKIVPNTIKDVLKKLDGGNIEMTSLAGSASKDELAARVYGQGETYKNLPSESKRKIDSLFMERTTNQVSFNVSDKMRAKVQAGLPLFARGAYFGTADNLQQAITQSFGKDTQKLLDSGQIRIVDKPSDIPGGPHPKDVKAATAPDGTVYMVAQNLSAGEIKSITLHEVGVHVGMRAMLGDDLFNDALKQVNDAIARGESWAQAARDSVPAETRLADIPEEQLAYLVQNSPELPFVQKIIAAVRAWFYRTFESARERMQLTEADFRELAVAGLRYAARQDRMQQMGAGDLMYARGDTPDASTVKAETSVEEAELKKTVSYANVLRAAADKLDNDVLAVQAMKSAMPEITAEEIDNLLTGLRREVAGLRLMTRQAREAVLAGQKADEMQSDAMIAANKMSADMEGAAIINLRNSKLNAAARLKLLTFANQFKEAGLDAEGFFGILGGSQRVRFGARLSVDAEAKAFRSEFVGGMLADMEKAQVKEIFSSGVFDREIYDALYKLGQKNPDMSTVSPQVLTVANIINKYQENARNRRNRFGAWIRDLTGYITRQSHDMYKIRAATEDEWVNFVKDKLDIPKMIRLGLISETDPIGSLRGLYNDFASGIHIKGVAGEEDIAAFSVGANLAKRESVSRSLYFKDGISAYEYNDKFGTGRLADSVLHGLERSAQSAALLKLLGTNPEANLTRVMDQYEATLTGERKTKFHEKRGAILNMLRQVDGTVNIPGDVTAAKIGGTLRAWQTMAKLGGSMISSFSDVAGFAADLRYAQDKNLLSGVGIAIGGLLQGRASGEKADILVSLGVFHESMAGAITQRFDSPELTGKMAAVMRQYFRFNGLTWWTETLRDAAALSHSSFLAAQKSRAYDALEPSVRRVLGQYGIDAAKWDLMRQGVFRNADGVDYLTPDAIRTIPREQLEAYITSVGRTPNDASVQNLIDDLSQTMRTMFIDRAHTAVIEPGARARAFMLRGTQAGTVSGELLRYITQFKSFSVAMTQMVLGREVYGRGYDTVGEYLRKGKGDMLGLATMVGLYTVLGYGSMMVKDLLKGRNPRDPLEPQTWMAALAQSGGLGIYGDFLFGEVARNSGSLVSTIAGPVAGLGDTVMNLFQRMRDGDDVAAASFRALLNNTPFLNLFYLRPLLDYLILFNIQESLNPGFLRRMEQRIQKENNQTFFIKPSEVVR